MPVKAGELNAALQYLRAKVPQKGMFSVLDELVQNAPFDRGSAEQWQQYLQPGQTLTRAGVNFPLKKEELEYSGLPKAFQLDRKSLAGEPWTKQQVLQELEVNRPTFTRSVNQYNPDPSQFPEESRTHWSYPEYAEHAHPTELPEQYTEDITRSPSFGGYPSHFSNKDLSWARTTQHTADTPPLETETARAQRNLVRLIEEIQSDRHESAAEKVYTPSPDLRTRIEALTGKSVPPQFENEDAFHIVRRIPDDQRGAALRDELAKSLGRRGYRTPTEEATDLARRTNDERDAGSYYLLPDEEQARLDNIRRKPPDTPFKNPEDYAGLEMRKQLLNAVNNGERYLALTRGSDQVQRYEQGMEGEKGEGMSYVYDTIYPSVLGKLARQYGAQMTEVPVKIGSEGKDIRAPTLIEYGVESPVDLLDLAPTNREAAERAHSLLDDFETIRGGNPEYDRALTNARQSLNSLESTGGTKPGSTEAGDNPHWSDLHDSLQTLHSLWSDFGEEGGLGTPKEKVAKTFPAMEITPEVADRVRKAGVPLWGLAGAAAAGLGSSYNDAQANPVVDTAEGHAAGGPVGAHMSSVDPLALVQAAKSRHYAYKPLGASNHILGEDYTPSSLQGRTITENPAAAAALTAQGVKGANRPALPRPSSPLNPVEAKVNGNALPGFAEGGEVFSKITQLLKRLLGNAPEAAAATPKTLPTEEFSDLMRRYKSPQGNQLSLEEMNRLIGSLANSPSEQSILGQPELPKQFPGNGGLGGRQADDLLSGNFASGGEVDNSSLKWLADKARDLGIPSYANDRARVATGVAKQFYGLDENGQPVLGGAAWTKGQHGTPPRILDELTTLPGNVIEFFNALNGPGPKGTGTMHAPDWSRDAQARLDALDKKVQEVTGVGQAKTLPEHIEDAASMLATPLPASKVAEEAPMLQRALEYIAPVRPPTVARYATDSAALGGVSAGLDKLIERLSQKPACEPGALDPEFEQAAMEHTNAVDQ